MAHFYGTIRGNGGEVSRTGTKSSGIRARVQGERIGGIAECEHLPTADEFVDRVTFAITAGRSGRYDIPVASARMVGDDPQVYLHSQVFDFISDDAITTLLQREPALAERLARLLFVNLDAVQR